MKCCSATTAVLLCVLCLFVCKCARISGVAVHTAGVVHLICLLFGGYGSGGCKARRWVRCGAKRAICGQGMYSSSTTLLLHQQCGAEGKKERSSLTDLLFCCLSRSVRTSITALQQRLQSE